MFDNIYLAIGLTVIVETIALILAHSRKRFYDEFRNRIDSIVFAVNRRIGNIDMLGIGKEGNCYRAIIAGKYGQDVYDVDVTNVLTAEERRYLEDTANLHRWHSGAYYNPGLDLNVVGIMAIGMIAGLIMAAMLFTKYAL